MDDFRIQRALRVYQAYGESDKAAYAGTVVAELRKGAGAKLFVTEIILAAVYGTVLTVLLGLTGIQFVKGAVWRRTDKLVSADAFAEGHAYIKLVLYSAIVGVVMLLIFWAMIEHKMRTRGRIMELAGMPSDWHTHVDRDETSAGIRAAVRVLRGLSQGDFRGGVAPVSSAGAERHEVDVPALVAEVAQRALAQVTEETRGMLVFGGGEGGGCSAGGGAREEADCGEVAARLDRSLGDDTYTSRAIREAWERCPESMLSLCQTHRGDGQLDRRALLQCETRIAHMVLRKYRSEAAAPNLAGGGWRAKPTVTEDARCWPDGDEDAVFWDGKACHGHKGADMAAGAALWDPAGAGGAGVLLVRGNSDILPPEFQARAASERIAAEVKKSFDIPGGLVDAASLFEDLKRALGAPADTDTALKMQRLAELVLGKLTAERPAAESLKAAALSAADVDSWLAGMSPAEFAAGVAWPLLRAAPMMEVRDAAVNPPKARELAVARYSVRWAAAGLGGGLAALLGWPKLRDMLASRIAEERWFVYCAAFFLGSVGFSYGARTTGDALFGLDVREKNTKELLKRYRRALAALGASLQSGWDAKAYLGSGAAPASKELYGDAFDDSPPPQVTAAKRSDAKSAFELLVSRGKMDTAAFARDVDDVIEAFDRCNALTARPKVGFPLLDFLVYGTLLGTSLVGAALSAGLVDVNRAVATARRVRALLPSAEAGDRRALEDLLRLVGSSDIDTTYTTLVSAVRWAFVVCAGIVSFRVLADTITSMADGAAAAAAGADPSRSATSTACPGS